MKAIKNLSFEAFLIRISAAFLILIFAGQVIAPNICNAQTRDQKQAQPQSQPANQDQTKDETYIIGNLDRLSVTFWQQPDLNRDVRVDENGMISLPVIGDIKAAGLTTSDLSKKIIQQMSIYNTPVSQATVTVTEFNSRSVVVAGQVLTPGSRRYEKIPDVWQVILDAGGPTATADLSRVSIVRKEGGKSDVITVDLYKIIQQGDLSKAPKLQAGDLVNVPLSSTTGGTVIPSARFEGKNIFYVFGQVTEQGPRNLEDGMDVLDGIALARGFTPDADLKNVRIIIKDAKYSNVIRLNMEKYIQSGTPPRMMLHPEDAIVVPAKSLTYRIILTDLSTIVPILTAMGTLFLLYREIRRNP